MDLGGRGLRIHVVSKVNREVRWSISSVLDGQLELILIALARENGSAIHKDKLLASWILAEIFVQLGNCSLSNASCSWTIGLDSSPTGTHAMNSTVHFDICLLARAKREWPEQTLSGFWGNFGSKISCGDLVCLVEILAEQIGACSKLIWSLKTREKFDVPIAKCLTVS